MTYRHICESCRKTLGIEASKTHQNRMSKRDKKRRKASDSGRLHLIPIVVHRTSTGKPLVVGFPPENSPLQVDGEDDPRGPVVAVDVTVMGCKCLCDQAGHDPSDCTGEPDFLIGGRPGTVAVDAKAAEFRAEPTPEVAAQMHEEVADAVRVVIAFLSASTDDERRSVESQLVADKVPYDKQIEQLCSLLRSKNAGVMEQEPYGSLATNLRRLAKFRNQRVAHTRATNGDWFKRTKRDSFSGQEVVFEITKQEVADQIDLGISIMSLLAMVPARFASANDDFEAVDRIIAWIEKEHPI